MWLGFLVWEVYLSWDLFILCVSWDLCLALKNLFSIILLTVSRLLSFSSPSEMPSTQILYLPDVFSKSIIFSSNVRDCLLKIFFSFETEAQFALHLYWFSLFHGIYSIIFLSQGFFQSCDLWWAFPVCFLFIYLFFAFQGNLILCIYFFKYKFIYFNWRLITLQYCIGFAIHHHMVLDHLQGGKQHLPHIGPFFGFCLPLLQASYIS